MVLLSFSGEAYQPAVDLIAYFHHIPFLVCALIPLKLNFNV
jgi:hypothetical protein